MRRVLVVLSMTICWSLSSYAWRETGGAESSQLDKSALTLMLNGGGLKKAMLNYLDSIRVDKIDDSTADGKIVKATFHRVLKNQALQRDIQTAANYVVSESCFDSSGAKVAGAAVIGEFGGRICFDVARLIDESRGLNDEQMLIKLATLAFHEHIHHFQSPQARTKDNEREAYLFASYVRMTARAVQVPLLEWRAPEDSKAKVNASKYTMLLKNLPAGSKIKVGKDIVAQAGTDHIFLINFVKFDFVWETKNILDLSDTVFTTESGAYLSWQTCKSSGGGPGVLPTSSRCFADYHYSIPLKNKTVKQLYISTESDLNCKAESGAIYKLETDSSKLTVDQFNRCMYGRITIIPNMKVVRP